MPTSGVTLGVASAATVAVSLVAALVGLAAERVQPLKPVDLADGPFALRPWGLVLCAALVAECWLLRPTRPQAATGLAAVGISVMLPALAGSAHVPNRVALMLLAVGPFAVPAAAAVSRSWTGLAGRRGLLLLAGALALASGLVHVLGYNPFRDPACVWVCPNVDVPESSVLTPSAVLALCAVLTATSGIAALASMGAIAPPRIVWVGAAAGVLAFAVAAAADWLAPATSVADMSTQLGVLALVVACGVSTYELRRVRSDVRRLATALAEPGRRLGGGPLLLAVHALVPEDGRWVDLDGVEVPEPLGASVTLDAADGTPAMLRLVVSRRELASGLVEAIRPEERWALEAARLRAVSRGRIRETQESQRRLVDVADRERLRLERDLHDGTQQQLVAAAVQLSIARGRLSEPSASTVHAAEEDVRQALSGLRRVARDNLSETLLAEGLQAAVEEVVAVTSTTTELSVSLDRDDLPPSVQRAVAEAVAVCLANTDAHADARRAWVDLREVAGEVLVAVGDDGRGGAQPGPGLTLLSDRVGALGGTFALFSPAGGGTVVSVALPCA